MRKSSSPSIASQPSSPGKAKSWALALILASMWAACGSEPEPVQPGDGVPSELRAGNWNRVRGQVPLTPDQWEEANQLTALGYADGVQEAPEIVQVTRHDGARAGTGLNFYVSGQAPEAFLIDMQGQVLHHWSHDYAELWPELEVKPDASGIGKWRRAHLYPNGDILAIHEGIGMIRLDADSKLLWQYPGRTHHDMHVTAEGRIWTLAREVGIHPVFSDERVSMDDVLVELDADGQELSRLSILECLQNVDSPLLQKIEYPDMFHANSIEVLDGKLDGRVAGFEAGNLLISLRHVHALVVIDVAARKVVWSLEGDFRWQHDAQITEAGSLLLYDNHRLPEAAPISKILEFDPASKELIWSFEGNSKEPFYSKTCGTTQRLGNQNTLITESDGGRAFEITSQGEVVWEYYNPHRGGPGNEFIACLFALHRVGPQADFDWLQGPFASEE